MSTEKPSADKPPLSSLGFSPEELAVHWLAASEVPLLVGELLMLEVLGEPGSLAQGLSPEARREARRVLEGVALALRMIEKRSGPPPAPQPAGD